MQQTKTIQYQVLDSLQELSVDEQKHIQNAQAQTQNAYAPYSNFKVGAIVVLEDGSHVIGSNQENRAYPSGLCAERVALFAVGAQHSDKKIKSIYIAAKGDLIEKDEMLSPCGACRQVLLESQLRQYLPIKIYLIGMNGKISIFDSVHDLLPFAFGM
ncbi:MAG: cytidine deaminase [Bacteroidetes bacterium]|nr:cytidine deaminase [Bacteroidota bacterium]